MIRVQSWLLTAKGLAPNLVPGKIAKRTEKSVLAPGEHEPCEWAG
jgi:hypothetical protein